MIRISCFLLESEMLLFKADFLSATVSTQVRGLNMTVTLPQSLTELNIAVAYLGRGANPKDLRKDKSLKFYPK